MERDGQQKARRKIENGRNIYVHRERERGSHNGPSILFNAPKNISSAQVARLLLFISSGPMEPLGVNGAEGKNAAFPPFSLWQIVMRAEEKGERGPY